MSAVDVECVSKSYGHTRAVAGVSFTVDVGEFLTVLGPSGCGKTTVLRIIAGFARPQAGIVRLGDTDVTRTPPYRRRVGVVFQNYALFPHMSVRENIGFGLKMHGIIGAEATSRVDEMLALMQLGDRAAHRPAQLSGGQQQRVALARALAPHPTVLLLDEPFSALDRQIGEHLRGELKSLQRRLKISTVLVTHAQDEALTLSDRLAVMNHGRIEQIGPPERLYAQPRNRFVAEFLGRSNIVQVDGGAGVPRIVGPAPTTGGTVAVPLAVVRPEAIRLYPAGASDIGAGYAGWIEDAQYLGPTRIIRVRLELGCALEVMALSQGVPAFAPGASVRVEVPDAAFHRLDGDAMQDEDG